MSPNAFGPILLPVGCFCCCLGFASVGHAETQRAPSVPVTLSNQADWQNECVAVLEALQRVPEKGPQAWEQWTALLARFPKQAGPTVEEARRHAGEAGSLRGGLTSLRASLTDGCRRPTQYDGVQSQLSTILQDPRFQGTRQGRDAFDRLFTRLQDWLFSWLASEGMRQYAGASRVVFLSLLLLALSLVAFRLWRDRRRWEKKSVSSSMQVQQQQVRGFEDWRQKAQQAREAGELKEALAAGQLALLARVGQLQQQAVSPARTNREILQTLDAQSRAALTLPLHQFDLLFYGAEWERAGGDDAVKRFLDAVDIAENWLVEQSTGEHA